MRVAVLLVAFATFPGCTCQRAENVDAKARLSQPPPPDPSVKKAEEKIDPSTVNQPEVMKRVSRMEASEVQHRLKSFVFESKGDLAFSRGDSKIKSAEQTRIVQSTAGDFSVAVKTGDGSTEDLAYTNGVLFLKNGNGTWRVSRDPTGERNAYRTDAAGVWKSFYDLFAHALVVSPNGVGDWSGRNVVKYTLTLADQSDAARAEGAKEPPAPSYPDGGAPDVESPAEKKRIADRLSKWRQKAKPAGGTGELFIDEQTSVPLHVKFTGAMLVGDGMEPARLDVDLTADYTEVGKEHEVQAPRDAMDDVVRKKYPVNPREFLEENGVVARLPDAGPARKKKPGQEVATPPDDGDAP